MIPPICARSRRLTPTATQIRHAAIATFLVAQCLLPTVCLLDAPTARAAGRLMLAVQDPAGAVMPCRVHLIGTEQQPVRPEGLPFWHDHFVCPGQIELDLPAGQYQLTIERGPEFDSHRQTIQVVDGEARQVEVPLRRIARLRDSGWYGADLHVHRPLEEIELLMQAEDLDFAPVITWWNNQNRWRTQPPPDQVVRRFDGHRLYSVMAGEDEREGGALLYFGLQQPLDIANATREVPSPLTFVQAAVRANPDVWIDIEKPFWWDVPTWLASGKMKSIGIANNHMWRHGMMQDEAWGRTRDKARLPDPLGVGHWTQEIYYHALNAGLRIPPSAGSASGVLPNPVGYNRVYVHVDQAFTHESWWESLAAGRCFVTNGPLLVCRADGNLPGHVFESPDGERLTVGLEIQLTSRERVDRLEILQNGQVVKTIACRPDVTQVLTADLSLEQSGWFLVRALASNDETFRFASTGPYYVEIGTQRQHISRKSCEFFRDWTEQRIARVEENIGPTARPAPNARAASVSADARQEVLRYHQQARMFWNERLARATAP